MSYEVWNWRFFGLTWSTGNKPVQDWFDLLPDDAKDEARDTFGYLQHLPNCSLEETAVRSPKGGRSE